MKPNQDPSNNLSQIYADTLDAVIEHGLRYGVRPKFTIMKNNEPKLTIDNPETTGVTRFEHEHIILFPEDPIEGVTDGLITDTPTETQAEAIDSPVSIEGETEGVKRNPLAGRLRPVTTPNGAGLAAITAHKKRMTEKCFVNFQTTVLLKTQLTSVTKINRINLSEYFRKCAEILIDSSNNEERLVEVSKLAASLVFKKKPRGPKPKKKK